MKIPKIGQALTATQVNFLEAFSKSCRHSIIEMLKNSQSGHPGGSLSAIDYLSLLYTFIISQTGEKVVVSNGHISPAVYSVLAELKYIDKKDVVKNFRKFGSIFEGHITRHVPGIEYGTGPLGIGTSVGSSFALANKLKNKAEKVYTLMGDGEAQEGQVYEVMSFAAANELSNLILFVDYNQVQLTDSLDDILPLNISEHFKAAGWRVFEVDGHNFEDMWDVIGKANKTNDKPVAIIGKTVMGKGVEMMEKDGLAKKSTWHGKAASPEDSDKILQDLKLNDAEVKRVEEFRKLIKWQPGKPKFSKALSLVKINESDPRVYKPGKTYDCRGAYGNALLDLAERNKNVVALSADLRGSVKTDGVAKSFPKQHIECGICEQNMVSLSGGLSLDGFIPFCSTFGAFMSSRAKDQARVNDINQCNVKMVATHCGLSVGEDGPTHQAIDDMTSFLGMFNSMVIEPADANQTDRIIRYIASHYGNFYVRMGRHKYEALTKEDGSVFYDENYKFEYGKSDVLRKGKDLTIVASGSMSPVALEAYEKLKKKKIQAEIVIVSSPKQFDKTVLESAKKTKKLVTVEDHNALSGMGAMLISHLTQNNIHPKSKVLGVREYQLSGQPDELYNAAGIGLDNLIEEAIKIHNAK